MAAIEHGTITGHAAGCKSDVTCPMTYEKPYAQRTCQEVALLYRRDYQFIKKIDAGMTPAEILAAEKVAEAEAKAAAAAAKAAARLRPPKPPREPKLRRVRETKGILGPDGLAHGTASGYVRCRTEDCPAVKAGLPSCGEVGRTVAREAWQRKHPPKPRKVAKHGTESGYVTLKCRDECPGGENGITCRQASSARARERDRKKREEAKKAKG